MRHNMLIRIDIQIHQPQERLDNGGFAITSSSNYLDPLASGEARLTEAELELADGWIQIHQPQERLDRRNQWLRIVYPHLDPLASGEARHNVALQMWQEPKFRSTSLRRGQTGINTKRLLITGIQIHQPQERLDTVLDSEQPMPYIFRSTSLRRGQTAINCTTSPFLIVIQIHQPQERLDISISSTAPPIDKFRSTSLRRGQTLSYQTMNSMN